MARKILVLFAHPAFHRSRANRAMADALQGVEGVTVHDLYEVYPDLLIDVRYEQGLLLQHDALVMQHPFYWYSAPALIKEWMDLVLTHGWAYGDTGRALEGKLWMNAISAGGGEESYGQEGYNRYSVDELLRPFEATANLCRMRWMSPFAMHASHMRNTQALADCAREYRTRVMALMRE